MTAPETIAQADGPQLWSWSVVGEILPDLLEGLLVTLRATAVGITVALLLGLVLAILRRSPVKLLSWPTAAVVEFVRSTPLLVQLFFLFFILPDLGIVLSGFTAGVIGLGVHYGTYTSETYRAGIESVPQGQWEAAIALNLNGRQTWTSVILPQAIPTVIPPLGNYVVAMLKDAPLLSTITVLDVLGRAQGISSRLFRPLEAFTMAGVLFLAASIPLAIGVRLLEKRFGYTRT